MNSAADPKLVFKRLKKTFPDAHCELVHDSPFQLLIATILSAQCTDTQVNKVTPALFKAYPNCFKLSSAPLDSIEALIHSTGFYKNKALNIQLCSRSLVDNFSGEVPKSIEELTSLAGVGRKTANVVLGNAFNINQGVVVDTHVKRIANLLGLSTSTTPEKIEQDLIKKFPRSNWTELSHLFIFLGRRICIARRPKCGTCPLNDICPSSKIDDL